VNSNVINPQRKALLVDADKDRNRRKERKVLLQNLGFKVFPALDVTYVRSRCKPGAFDLIVVNAGENVQSALELCDAVRAGDQNQQLFMISSNKEGIPARDYLVSDWDELQRRLSGSAKNEPAEQKTGLAAA
jgi:PleD family two-component response regulator